MENYNEFITYSIIVFVGVVASVINVMAGGGSAISVGVLTLLGVPVIIANGTNRVGVITAGISSVKKYSDKGKLDIKGALPFAIIALFGSLLGALCVSAISAENFKNFLAIVMIFIVITLFIPKNNSEKGEKRAINKFLSYLLMFIIGFYGGFIQAGVGFLIMAFYRHLYSLDLVTINGRKMFITTIFTIPAIIVFALNNQINWGYAIALSIGNYIGGTLTSAISIKKGDKVVKNILALSIILMAVKLAWRV